LSIPEEFLNILVDTEKNDQNIQVKNESKRSFIDVEKIKLFNDNTK
jgi:hypothetical protein